MIKIPSPETKKWSQSNASDLYGVIVETRNISFEDRGYLKLANSSRAIYSENINSDFSRAAVIMFNGDATNYFVQTQDEPWSLNREVLSSLPTQITTTNHPNGSSKADAEWFDSKIAVSESNDVHYYEPSDNSWVDTNISLSSASSTSQHPVTNFLSKAALAVGNENTVLLYSALSATPTLLATLTIPSDFQVTSLEYFNQNLYIGTRHKYGSDAAMYVWTGEGTAAQSVYALKGATSIFDVIVHEYSITVFGSNGGLYTFNGVGFTLLDAFPIYYTDRVLIDDNNVGIFKNCLKSRKDSLYISFSDDDNIVAQMLNQPAGVWCYIAGIGLHHKYSYSIASVYIASDPSLDTGTDAIVVGQKIITGTELWYIAGTPNSSLDENTKYYAIYVDDTHVKLATSLANAVAGTAVNFSADDGATEKFIFFPNIDFGQITASTPGAIQTIDFSQTRPFLGIDVIWSGELYLRTNATGSEGFTGTVTPGAQNRGHFVIPKVYSSEITDTFNNISLKFFPLENESDKIIIKYRLVDDLRNEVDLQSAQREITWTSATTFTTTQADWVDAVVGDEVVILQGAGAGILAHISSISENAGTYTVTIDESFENYTSGDKAEATFRKWKKWKTITYGDENAEKGYLSDQLGKKGKFIQFKIELRGIGVKIEEFAIDNLYKLSARKSRG